jgi:hypothetical protein
VPGEGFEQCYNAQAAVAADSLMVLGTEVTRAANDKEQVAPMLEKVQELPEELGEFERLLTNNGYLSELAPSPAVHIAVRCVGSPVKDTVYN